MRDHDICISPGVLLEHLQRLNCDCLDSILKIELNVEKRLIKIMMDDGESAPLEVKMKFFALPEMTDCDEEEGNQRIRVSFIKKKGDLAQWYKIFQDLSDSGLSEYLQCPESYYKEKAIINTVSTLDDSTSA